MYSTLIFLSCSEQNPSFSFHPWYWANLGTKKLCSRLRTSLPGTKLFMMGTEEALKKIWICMFDCWNTASGAGIMNTPRKVNTILHNLKYTHNCVTRLSLKYTCVILFCQGQKDAAGKHLKMTIGATSSDLLFVAISL